MAATFFSGLQSNATTNVLEGEGHLSFYAASRDYLTVKPFNAFKDQNMLMKYISDHTPYAISNGLFITLGVHGPYEAAATRTDGQEVEQWLPLAI
jgi:hypothetical protein